MQASFDFARFRDAPSVSELVEDLRGVVESGFHNIWVRGEISDFRAPASGHFYFALKDDRAQLRAVCFRMQNRYLKFRPGNGLEIVARGSASVYAPRGDLQLIIDYMEPLGDGALRLAFEQLKQRLLKEGLFDSSRKKPLPLLPAKIGVVTSPSGAAIQDILRVLNRRNDRLSVLVLPVRVQGGGASEEIARAIRTGSQREDLDVLILARGGGSTEDLWAFNEERVARAIAESRIPVISAVGHETDFTIADFVADLRAPTPSAAAEIVSATRQELASRVSQLDRRALHALQLMLQKKRRQLQLLSSSRSFVHAETRLRLYQQRLDDLAHRLCKSSPGLWANRRNAVSSLDQSLRRCLEGRLESRRQRLGNLQAQLRAFSPLAVLERGYAIVTDFGQRVVRDPRQLALDSEFRVRVARGDFRGRRIDNDSEG